MIPSSTLGVLQKPLSALVFHYEECGSRLGLKPCEAAFLARQNLQMQSHPTVKSVTIMASPSNLLSLTKLYQQIPGVAVGPFKLLPRELNIGTMLTLMAVDQSDTAPLYMSQVTRILREMATDGLEFSYHTFKYHLDQADLDRRQREFLSQRLDLLESFLDLKGNQTSPGFESGTVTIIDMSCPFVDANTACVLFKIAMEMYLRSNPGMGKIIALDEAHKVIFPESYQLTSLRHLQAPYLTHLSI